MNGNATSLRSKTFATALTGALLLAAAPASWGQTTVTGQYCMQRIFMGPSPATLSGANQLNCTANDIRLSKATSWSPNSCLAGTKFTLTATFDVDVTANARYDAAFFFRLDGGGSARGDGVNATGSCSVTQLEPGKAPALNLDGDSCGDLNAGKYNVTFTIPDVLCQDTNGNGKLNLPNCTSWHSNQGTACTRDSNPFDANPDTKSKCVCDDGFEVPVDVELGSISVTKDVKAGTPPTLPEPGGEFEYALTVLNKSQVQTVTIDRICDDKYGEIAYASGTLCAAGTEGSKTWTDCSLTPAVVLSPGQTYACSFKAKLEGDPRSLTDTVTFHGRDGSGVAVSASDSATVSITNVPPSATVTKSLVSLGCSEVNYQVKVTNTDKGEAITLTTLTDSQFGSITSVQGSVLTTTCAVPQTIAEDGLYECTFKAKVCTAKHENIVTATVTDNEGGSKAEDSNKLTVNINATTGP
jgi:hypothetical protein